MKNNVYKNSWINKFRKIKFKSKIIKYKRLSIYKTYFINFNFINSNIYNMIKKC